MWKPTSSNREKILKFEDIKMVGVLFIVTIPTEQEERNIELNEKHVKFGHSSTADISNQESDKHEYGTFKVVSSFFSHIEILNSAINAVACHIGTYRLCKNQLHTNKFKERMY